MLQGGLQALVRISGIQGRHTVAIAVGGAGTQQEVIVVLGLTQTEVHLVRTAGVRDDTGWTFLRHVGRRNPDFDGIFS